MSITAAMFHHFHDGKKHIMGQGSLDAETFGHLLDSMKSTYRILPPAEFAEKVLGGCLAADEICLTFDDALKCQVDIALPVLRKKGVNAFFFVYSKAFYGPPDNLEVFRDFRHREFADIDLFYESFFRMFEERNARKFKRYLLEYPRDYLKDYPFYTEMDRRFRFVRDNILEAAEYESTLFRMMDDCGYSIEEHSRDLFMTEADLYRLRDAGNVIGLHSNSHPTTIDKFDRESQWREYTANRDFLEELLGEKMWAMSHPCGRYNESTLQILRDLGIRIGFRSSLAIKEIRSPLEIPREDHSNLLRDLLRPT